MTLTESSLLSLSVAEQQVLQQEVARFMAVIQQQTDLSVAITTIRQWADEDSCFAIAGWQSLKHDHSQVFRALSDLQHVLQQLAPPTELTPEPKRWWTLFSSSPAQRYFQQYQQQEPVLVHLVTVLRQYADDVLKEQIALQQQQQKIGQYLQRLAKYEFMAQLVAQQFTVQSWPMLAPFSPTQDDVVVVLTRQQANLAQQKVVSLQAMLALKLQIQNTQTLQQHIEQVLSTTVMAIRVAVLLAPILSQPTLTLTGLHGYQASATDQPQTWADLQHAFHQALQTLAALKEKST